MHLNKLKTEALELEKKNLLYSPYNQRRIHFPTKYFIYSEEWPIVGFTQSNKCIFFIELSNQILCLFRRM